MKKLIQAYQAQLLAVRIQADGKLGIENLKMILEFLVTFLVGLTQAIKDRAYTQIAALIFTLLRYGNIVALAKMAWDEFKDLSAEESALVSAHFAKVFDLRDDELEAKIEQAVAIIPVAYDIVNDTLDLVSRGQGIWAQLVDIFKSAAPEEPIA